MSAPAEVLAKLAAGRFAACRRLPYYTAAVHGLIPHPAPGLGTTAVSDRGVYLYDPEVIAAWAVEDVATSYLHEAWHWVRRHGARRQTCGAEARAWNTAADAELGDDLEHAGCRMLPTDITPRGLGLPNGQTAEWYYSQRPPQALGQSHFSGGRGGRACGSGAGAPHPGEAEHVGALTAQGVEGRSEAELSAVIQSVAAATVQHAASKGRGSVPADQLRWAEEQLTPPRVPWQRLLAQAVRRAVTLRAGQVDYSYQRPARRQAALGYGVGRPVLPGMTRPIPAVAFALDTSGSMVTAEITSCLSEARGVIQAVGSEVTILACDATVHGVRQVRHLREARRVIRGGGGTDFRPIFAALAKRRVGVIVVATDGFGPAPAAPPAGANVIWLLVPGGQPPCTWGQVVRMEAP